MDISSILEKIKKIIFNFFIKINNNNWYKIFEFIYYVLFFYGQNLFQFHLFLTFLENLKLYQEEFYILLKKKFIAFE